MNELSGDQVLALDRAHLWHPYSSLDTSAPLYPISSAQGCELILTDGRRLVDGMSSWWSAIHGYNLPELNRAANEQLEKMAHVMFGGLTHEPAARLGQRLVEITPEGLDRVFLADSGSVSVEVAIKMAVQYQLSRGHHGKTRLLSLRNAYHGDTLGAMSLCDRLRECIICFNPCFRPNFLLNHPPVLSRSPGTTKVSAA